MVLPRRSVRFVAFQRAHQVEEFGLSGRHDGPDDLAATVVGVRMAYDRVRFTVHEERVLVLLVPAPPLRFWL